MSIYQDLILDHAKHPQHSGLREPYDAEVTQRNTSCGDEVTLRVTLTGTGPDAVVSDVSYTTTGCSISTASISVLAQEVVGRTLAEGLATRAAMRRMLSSRGQDLGDESEIGDGVAFAGVAKFPARVKCALLGWSAWAQALLRAGVDPALVSDDDLSLPKPQETS